jgi:hypothetical protein
MTRSAVLSLLLAASVPLAVRADYLFIKVDLNQIEELLKDLPVPGAGAAAFNPGGMPSTTPMPMPMAAEQVNFPTASPQPKWLMGFVEMKNPLDISKKNSPVVLAKREQVGQTPKYLMMYRVQLAGAKTGNSHFVPFFANVDNAAIQYSSSPKELQLPTIPLLSPAKEFEKRYRLKTEKRAEVLQEAALWAIERGLLSEFHAAMKGLRDAAPKSPFVLNYLRVKEHFVKDLKKTNLPDDPSWRTLVANLSANGYQSSNSEHGRFLGLAKVPPGQEAQIRRRLARLEELTEQFHFWCAMQLGMPPLAMPKYKTLVVLAGNADDYQSLLRFYGRTLSQGDGFAPRRHNVILLSFRRFDRYAPVLDKLHEKYKEKGVSRDEDLVQGDMWLKPNFITYSNALAMTTLQNLALIHKQMDDDWEAVHVTHEGMKQILLSSNFLPRNVHLPEWFLEGLAGYFETPAGALSGGAGRLGISNLTLHKFYRRERQLGQNPQVLFNVVSDKYFREADLLASKDPDKSAELREIGRVFSWSFLFHLLQERSDNNQLGKLDLLLAYRDRLHQLPRDLELEDTVYQRLISDAFNLGKEPLAKNKGLSQLAESWFDSIPNQSLEIPLLDSEYLAIRAMEAREKKPSPAP